jgi:hypothetical protein
MVAAARPTPPGFISAHEVYTLDEFCGRMKLGTAAMRSARRKGLPVRQIGSRGYVLGSDLIEYISREPEACYNKTSRPSATNARPALTTPQP